MFGLYLWKGSANQMYDTMRCELNKNNERTSNTQDPIRNTLRLTNGSVSFYSVLNECLYVWLFTLFLNSNKLKTIKSTVTSKFENVSSLILLYKKGLLFFSTVDELNSIEWTTKAVQILSLWMLISSERRRKQTVCWQLTTKKKKGKLDQFALLFVIVSMFHVPCCLVKWILLNTSSNTKILGSVSTYGKRDKNKMFSLFVLLSIERRSNYMFSNIVYWFKFSHASVTLAFAIHNGISCLCFFCK